MTSGQIATRLQIHILTLCFASLGKTEGTVREATDALLDEVEKIVAEAIKAAKHTK